MYRIELHGWFDVILCRGNFSYQGVSLFSFVVRTHAAEEMCMWRVGSAPKASRRIRLTSELENRFGRCNSNKNSRSRRTSADKERANKAKVKAGGPPRTGKATTRGRLA